MSPNTFSCPSCGGTLEFRGDSRTVKCPYCGTVAEVPEELWQPLSQARTIGQWKKWIAIFLVLTVGIPTCLGIIGTMLGIGGGILGVLAPFVAAWLGG